VARPVEHRPYPKISNRRADTALRGGTWVATEKVHGAHLVVATDGRTVRIGNRRRWLEEADAFFGWQLLRAELGVAAQALFRELGVRGIVRLHGELFGGRYPHESVPPMPGATPVQTGIWYAPEVRFALFDIVVEPAEREEGEFLAHSEVQSLGAAHGLFIVPVLGRGPRSDVERLPLRFASHVPMLLGLPRLDGNMAEGLVLKPDARMPPSMRFVTKVKLPEFDDARFDESTPWNRNAPLDLEALRALASRMINGPRLDSARSKVGPARTALVDEVVLDVLADLDAAFPLAYRSLSPAEEDLLRAHVVAAVVLLDVERR